MMFVALGRHLSFAVTLGSLFKLTMSPMFVEANATTARCENGSMPTEYGNGSTVAMAKPPAGSSEVRVGAKFAQKETGGVAVAQKGGVGGGGGMGGTRAAE